MDKKQLYLCKKVSAQLCGLEYKELLCGCEKWTKNGILHREDGPALIKCSINDFCDSQYSRYVKEVWFNNSLLHRIGGPAIIWIDGPLEWWENGIWIRNTYEKTTI